MFDCNEKVPDSVELHVDHFSLFHENFTSRIDNDTELEVLLHSAKFSL